MSEHDDIQARRRILPAFYHHHDRAETALRRLMDTDFAPHRISLRGKASSSGDDPLGVYYSSAGERMKAGGVMVGGAVLSQLGVAIHGMAVPEDGLEGVRQRLDQGQTL